MIISTAKLKPSSWVTVKRLSETFSYTEFGHQLQRTTINFYEKYFFRTGCNAQATLSKSERFK